MRRSGLRTLLVFVVVSLFCVGGTIAASWRPLLGLDLQGGVSVVLKPKVANTPEDQLAQAIAIIRGRVDSLGVAEPDISRQGANIVVQLPGVKDQTAALELIGQTAELRFRPVLQESFSPDYIKLLADKAAKSGSTTTTGAAGDASSTTSAASSTEKSLADLVSGGGAGESAAAATTSTSPATPPTAVVSVPAAAASTDTSLPAPSDAATATAAPASAPGLETGEVTANADDQADVVVLLPDKRDPTLNDIRKNRYILGPALATGRAIESAQQALSQNGQWQVNLKFKSGAEGAGAWQAAAAACFSKSAACPTGRLAVVLDHEVLSAPSVNSDFHGDSTGVISGSFKQNDATALATALKYGSLPVELERQQSQEVSATVGKDALHAGVVAGLLGLALVAVYILLYYRILGLVAIASLTLSFGLLWSIISYLGAKQGLALSLSGVVGIIVSIGISIDSNIVYFETIKDDMAAGRTLHSSAERAFKTAMSTIIKADLVSLIAAFLLWILTVGAVRGFAFYLGLATVLDLIASYYFMRPAVLLLARTERASASPGQFGIPKPAAAKPVGSLVAS